MSQYLTKSDIAAHIAEHDNLSIELASRVVRRACEFMSSRLRAGEQFQLRGLGSFLVIERAEKAGRNPKTGETISLPARRVVRFRPSADIKDALKGK